MTDTHWLDDVHKVFSATNSAPATPHGGEKTPHENNGGWFFVGREVEAIPHLMLDVDPFRKILKSALRYLKIIFPQASFQFRWRLFVCSAKRQNDPLARYEQPKGQGPKKQDWSSSDLENPAKDGHPTQDYHHMAGSFQTCTKKMKDIKNRMDLLSPLSWTPYS